MASPNLADSEIFNTAILASISAFSDNNPEISARLFLSSFSVTSLACSILASTKPSPHLTRTNSSSSRIKSNSFSPSSRLSTSFYKTKNSYDLQFYFKFFNRYSKFCPHEQ